MITPVLKDIYTHCDNVARRNMQHYEQFIETCTEGFDENAVDPESVARWAQRFAEIRACFLVGEPIETDIDLQLAVLKFKAHARTTSSDVLRDVDKALALLSEFADVKAKAIRHRLAGKMAIALRLESVAEARYKQLPAKWKW